MRTALGIAPATALAWATLLLTLLAPSAHAVLVGAVLPSSRSVQVGETATAFATVINASSETATNCGLAPLTNVDVSFQSRITDPATNQPIEPAAARADIAPGGVQTYVFGLQANSAFAPVNVELVMDCDNTEPAAVVPGLNTLQLSASSTPVPDIVALSATLANDGVVRSPGTAGTGVFSLAVVNVGAGGLMTVHPTITGSEAVAFLCETDPIIGTCISDIGVSVQTSIGAAATPTFGVFVQARGRSNFDPANIRVNISIDDASGVSRGATSVAFETQTDVASGGGELFYEGVTVNASANNAIAPVEIEVVAEAAPPAALPASFGAQAVSRNITVSDETRLDAPLEFTINYEANLNDASVMVLHYDARTQTYEPTTVLNQDESSNTITIDSRNFSSFVVATLEDLLPETFAVTGFDATKNAWNISNFGSYFSPGGNCLGMSGYAVYSFSNESTNLNGRFSAAGGDPTSIAHLTATRAHLAQSQYWAIKQFTSLNELPESKRALLMKAALALFDKPLILLLGQDGRARHATVLTGYDASGFQHYEVNSNPGATRMFTVPFDGTSFGEYNGYNSFGFVAFPSLGRKDDFAALTEEALGEFAGSSDIVVTEPHLKASPYWATTRDCVALWRALCLAAGISLAT